VWKSDGRRRQRRALAALYFKLHVSTTSGKGALGSSQMRMVELEVVAVPALGRKITVEELGVDDED